MTAKTLKRAAYVACLVCALSLCGCATATKSAGLGAAVGAGTGVAIGAIADPGHNGQYRTRNVIIGGTLGTVAGAVAGSTIYSGNEKSKELGFKEGQSTTAAADLNDPPRLIPAQWRAEVVPARRVGNRLIPKHVEYVITDPARWEDPQ